MRRQGTKDHRTTDHKSKKDKGTRRQGDAVKRRNGERSFKVRGAIFTVRGARFLSLVRRQAEGGRGTLPWFDVQRARFDIHGAMCDVQRARFDVKQYNVSGSAGYLSLQPRTSNLEHRTLNYEKGTLNLEL